MSILEVDSVYASYGKKEVLRGISLYVEQGEIVALIGPNGAGKSTLLKVIAGLLIQSKGEVFYKDSEITLFSAHKRASLGISYFMQGGRIFQDLTIKDNLAICLTSQHDKNDKILSALTIFPKLEEISGRCAGALSGGERQMLALAMAFIKRPQIVLLDEPSAGLSPRIVQDVLSKVLAINRELGTTILLVEQNLGETLKIADRIIVLVNGSVVSNTNCQQDALDLANLEILFFGNRAKELET